MINYIGQFSQENKDVYLFQYSYFTFLLNLKLKKSVVFLIAGDQLPCPNNTRSETAFTPGCGSKFC